MKRQMRIRQQLSLPPRFQSLLSEIAEREERSMSASVRVMIARRASELGLDVDNVAEDAPEVEAAR